MYGIFAMLNVWRTSCIACVASALESDLKNNVGFLVRCTVILKWHFKCVILLWKFPIVHVRSHRIGKLHHPASHYVGLGCSGDHRASTPSEIILEGDVVTLVEISL
jgi:hypothetical protein